MTTPPCATTPDLWFSEAAEAIAEAKRLCGGCLERVACLALAIETRDGWAVMGGLTPAERKPLLPPLTCGVPGCDLPTMPHNGALYCSPTHSRDAHAIKQRQFGARRPAQMRGKKASAA